MKTSIRFILLWLLVLPFAGGVPAGAQDTLRLTLDSCIVYAYGHNYTVQAALLQREAAVAALQQASLWLVPSLSASAGSNLSFYGGSSTLSSSYGVGSSWTLFEGLSNYNSYRGRRAEQQGSELEVEKSYNDVATQIVTAYLDVVSARERVDYLRQQLQSAQTYASDARTKYRAGSIIESDYLLLAANERKAQCELNNAIVDVGKGLDKLRLLLGTDRPVDVVPITHEAEPPAVLPTLDAVLCRAVDSVLPDVRAGEMAVQKAAYDLRAAKGSYAPRLSADAYASYYGGDRMRTDAGGMLITSGGLNTNLGLSLSLPIFYQGSRRLQLAQSKIALQQAELQLSDTRSRLRQTVSERYSTLMQSIANLEAARQMQQARKASLDAYQEKFKAGKVSATELLQQQENYIAALYDYMQCKYTYILSEKILCIYLGTNTIEK